MARATWSTRGTLTPSRTARRPRCRRSTRLGRLVANGTTNYNYDALDRVAAHDGQAFTYAGAEIDPVTDGTFTYGRSPSGDVVSASNGAGAWLVARDRHGDQTDLFGLTGTVASTRLYDPFGDVVGETGTVQPTIGFQGDWTDPTSSSIWMGARWYGSDTGASTAETPSPAPSTTARASTGSPTRSELRSTTSIPTAMSRSTSGMRFRRPTTTKTRNLSWQPS